MKLTDGEKLIALMLADLHDHLDIDGDIDFSFVRNAIYNDNLWSIPFKYSTIQGDEFELPEDVKEVLNIMDMWRFIEYHYSQLNTNEKEELAKLAHPFGKSPKFSGFDGNEEPEFLSIAECIVDEHGRFAEFKDRDLNSHAPRIGTYRRMLPVFEKLRSLAAYNEKVTANHLAEILKEKVHPSMR